MGCNRDIYWRMGEGYSIFPQMDGKKEHICSYVCRNNLSIHLVKIEGGKGVISHLIFSSVPHL